MAMFLERSCIEYIQLTLLERRVGAGWFVATDGTDLAIWIANGKEEPNLGARARVIPDSQSQGSTIGLPQEEGVTEEARSWNPWDSLPRMDFTPEPYASHPSQDWALEVLGPLPGVNRCPFEALEAYRLGLEGASTLPREDDSNASVSDGAGEEYVLVFHRRPGLLTAAAAYLISIIAAVD